MHTLVITMIWDRFKSKIKNVRNLMNSASVEIRTQLASNWRECQSIILHYVSWYGSGACIGDDLHILIRCIYYEVQTLFAITVLWYHVRAGHVFFFFFFFNAPIRLNPTTNTLIPDHPARFLFLAPIANYLDEIFPDPEGSIRSPDIPDIDRTGVRTVFMFAFFFFFFFFFSSFRLIVGVC